MMGTENQYDEREAGASRRGDLWRILGRQMHIERSKALLAACILKIIGRDKESASACSCKVHFSLFLTNINFPLVWFCTLAHSLISRQRLNRNWWIIWLGGGRKKDFLSLWVDPTRQEFTLFLQIEAADEVGFCFRAKSPSNFCWSTFKLWVWE